MFSGKISSRILGCILLLQAVSTVNSEPANPPARTGCTSLAGEVYNCNDGGWCKPDLTETQWECFSAAGVPVDATAVDDDHDHDHESESGTCVVHGGHTHGDCSAHCTGIETGEYNKGLHIGAIFIMLVSSAIGVFTPLLFHKGVISNFRGFFFATKHFGTGVIICTALSKGFSSPGSLFLNHTFAVHLLYHSFIMFNNDCLAERLAYDAVAPALALAALLVTFIIDYAVHRYIRKNTPAERQAVDQLKTKSKESHQSSSSVESGGLSTKQDIVNVQLLEAGIIFHSIMIGVSLGATGGSEWIPLLCAIVFHQMFEGLGLGSRIAELTFPAHGAWKKWVMGILFAIITPVGVAIGVGVHESYNPNSVSALAAIGVLNALSAGILLYTGIVEMLVNDFIHGELKHAKALKAGLAIAFILLGAFGMAVIGKWA
ncbi:hypothetical protein AAF712_003599 [Marasmius tenuissimus]|uniref:Uncharacterized protein n=1 Tax=Marasmius tenuissimus TaxID=585030 RepID=A0ABR3A5T1_9AGAR